MGLIYSNTAATTAAVTNRFVVSTNMSLTPYTIANASPVWGGACLVTITHTTVAGADTLGTITLVGTGLSGNAITEIVTPIAGSTATSVNFFRTLTSATSIGWAAVSTADTLVIGCAAGNYVASSGGNLGGILVNNVVATAFTVADKRGTIATIPASQAAGTLYSFGSLGVDFSGYLQVSTTSTNDVTVFHTGTVPPFPNG